MDGFISSESHRLERGICFFGVFLMGFGGLVVKKEILPQIHRLHEVEERLPQLHRI
jgi:hypothetical protein